MPSRILGRGYFLHAPSINGRGWIAHAHLDHCSVQPYYRFVLAPWRSDFSFAPVGSTRKGALIRANHRYTSFMDPSSKFRSVWDSGYFHISEDAQSRMFSQPFSVVIALLSIPVLLNWVHHENGMLWMFFECSVAYFITLESHNLQR